ncbi:putative Ig domain-containing protein [Kingella potus]|uniref:putative Ig domain-containing protein n=1 Tax=Kingella potus TaxID=265175 RepID=UPI001FD56B0F|nr:putative Ig domain-containing protein [Kingella potus]UOP01494.1 putative Ig domain-containing protein [Kingella potus]
MGAERETHFLSFNVFAGGKAEMEYLRHIGMLDEEFRPLSPQALNLTQYLTQVAAQNGSGAVSVQGPAAATGSNGQAYLPSGTDLPFALKFRNTTAQPAGEIRLLTRIDPNLDAYSVRLKDLKIGDINIHLPGDKASFQGDFDFTGSKGFILRVSAGVDAQQGIVTWLLQAVDADTGLVVSDGLRGLLPGANDGSSVANTGYAAYTAAARDSVVGDVEISAQARIFIGNTPPQDSGIQTYRLDSTPPQTVLTAVAQTVSDGLPVYRVQWQAQDKESGVRHVTVYVAKDGGDFRIWKKQAAGAAGEALFTGEAGSSYEFLAAATDMAGNRETADIRYAVLPDDGTAAQVAERLGIRESLQTTHSTPLAKRGRSYADNALFTEAKKQLPGLMAGNSDGRSSDIRTVLAPFAARGLASGYAQSRRGVGASAMVLLPDGTLLVSGGTQRRQIFAYDAEKGGNSNVALFETDEPVLDMAADGKGRLWLMTGHQLWLADAQSGRIVERYALPNGEPLTHALAIDPDTGKIYVTSGSGIEIFDPSAPEGRAWQHFSNHHAADLAFGTDGRLWAVSRQPGGLGQTHTDIVSFPMSGKFKGRAELEYRLAGQIGGIAFGQAGSVLDGLLVAAARNGQSVTEGDTTSVWLIALSTREALQLATGGTRAEAVLASSDGRILVAQTNFVDEVAPAKAPKVLAGSVRDGSLLPLPLGQITLRFDQAMWTGSSGRDSRDAASVLNPENYRLVSTTPGSNQLVRPESVRYDEAGQSVVLTLPDLAPEQWRLEVSTNIQGRNRLRLDGVYTAVFTTVSDFSEQVRIRYRQTRADRLSGSVSYDVDLTNIGSGDIRGPLLLLLDPGRYFGAGIGGAQALSGSQEGLWLIDATEMLEKQGGRLAAGQTLRGITVSLVSANTANARLVKAEPAHRVYALPHANTPPLLGRPSENGLDTVSDGIKPAVAGQAWSDVLAAEDKESRRFTWTLLQAPQGMRLDAGKAAVPTADGSYRQTVALHWTPAADDLADNEILVRVTDDRGGSALKRYTLHAAGANRPPQLAVPQNITLAEGEALALPLVASDADGDTVTVLLKNLPAGAQYDAGSGILRWQPGYDQAEVYSDIEAVAHDGKHSVRERFAITVTQGYAKPELAPVAVQQLREGERFALQLAGGIAGGLQQAGGERIELSYHSSVLPAGAVLDSETGWLTWTPSFNQAGRTVIPIRLTATHRPAAGGSEVAVSVSQDIVLDVANANGAPEFGDAQAWQLVEGQPLRISVFAFDPDNPHFTPKIRLGAGREAVSQNGGDVAASVRYRVEGLPEGAVFDPETLEIVWQPGYTQAGTYRINVTATDDGNGTGVPLSSSLTFPIIVENANRAPQIGQLDNVAVARGQILEIPVAVQDADGNGVELVFAGLPPFAVFTQTRTEQSAQGRMVHGIIRLAPQQGDKGSHTVVLTATDNGDGDSSARLSRSSSFTVTVKNATEALVISLPSRISAVIGQKLSIPILVSDADQDELHYTVQGLPSRAELVREAQYGRARIEWTPTAAQAGSHDLTVVVRDSGLPSESAGHIPDPSRLPAVNTDSRSVRITVRERNLAPEIVAVEAFHPTGRLKTANQEGALLIHTAEGIPLRIEAVVRDADLDAAHWTGQDLPPGMTAVAQPSGNGQTLLVLNWLPDHAAAQRNNGTYRFKLGASDGSAQTERTVEIRVAESNLSPELAPLPLQLVREGETLSFNLTGSDADGDALRYALVYDENTPEGISFNGADGTFEWTPPPDTVDNAAADSRTYTFNFTATDGKDTVRRSVRVRVLDVNRSPEIRVGRHAAVVGETLRIPVVKSSESGAGIRISDADGAAQTRALSLAFHNLPEGAVYDAAEGELRWTPGPAQTGDYLIRVQADDGRNSSSRILALRVVADKSAIRPQIALTLTPSDAVLPGQTVSATVRAKSYADIADVSVQVRGTGWNPEQPESWQHIALDNAGRLKLNARTAGIIELLVRATDADGFVHSETGHIKVRDSLDAEAPEIRWRGALSVPPTSTMHLSAFLRRPA